MRTKNARAIDPDESAHLALVKSCACVFCDAAPPVEAHHVKQGRHFCTVAACKRCHDAKAWRIGRPNEFDAINETNRRVARLQSGQHAKPAPAYRKPRAEAARPTSTLPRQRDGDVLPKIVPRRV